MGLVSAGQEEIVRELVGAGADVNRKNEKGITPLSVVPSAPVSVASNFVAWPPFRHYAASKSRIEVRALQHAFWDDHTHFPLDRSLFDRSRSRCTCCLAEQISSSLTVP